LSPVVFAMSATTIESRLVKAGAEEQAAPAVANKATTSEAGVIERLMRADRTTAASESGRAVPVLAGRSQR
jgi:hypothetical protein